jgi:sigma-B regulation protein RsbU (phosphoserine phosphatase)
MRLLNDMIAMWRRLGRTGQIFLVSVLASAGLRTLDAPGFLQFLAGTAAFVTGCLLLFRLFKWITRHFIWRLRNRLIVAYVFIALVPILLIATLAYATAWALSGQIGVYLVTSEFDRRVSFLKGAAANLARTPQNQRSATVERLGALFRERIPGLEIAVFDEASQRFPAGSQLEFPPAGWKEASGIVLYRGDLHVWTVVSDGPRRVVALAPLSKEFLDGLVPELGHVSVLILSGEGRKALRRSPGRGPAALEPALNQLDLEVAWGSLVSVARWDAPGVEFPSLFSVRTRVSSVLKILFSQKSDWDNSYALLGIRVIGFLFLIVEFFALLIGIQLSRSITNAVHDLYEGTERVMEGDFTHRIAVKGRDQLAALSQSFNRMSENLERLLKVAKEKERFEAELEIARTVQKQLYPTTVPESASLRLTAFYKPARSVSGDYYDYQRLAEDKISFTLGDVAGKGISAALLMATIQSSFRTEVKFCIEHSKAAGGSAGTTPDVSTSAIVSSLNRHLHQNTPAEKFATFFFGIYDEAASTLHYTNAGHLEPILVRGGKALRLGVDGMVIGAFPFARYGESRVELEPGDLLVIFTDGISEPENEYSEMFGEDRLVDLVLKNAHRPDAELIHLIVEAVSKWTGSEELQDDMTLLVARRL